MNQEYTLAKAKYAAIGIDTDAVIEELKVNKKTATQNRYGGESPLSIECEEFIYRRACISRFCPSYHGRT